MHINDLGEDILLNILNHVAQYDPAIPMSVNRLWRRLRIKEEQRLKISIDQRVRNSIYAITSAKHIDYVKVLTECDISIIKQLSAMNFDHIVKIFNRLTRNKHHLIEERIIASTSDRSMQEIIDADDIFEFINRVAYDVNKHINISMIIGRHSKIRVTSKSHMICMYVHNYIQYQTFITLIAYIPTKNNPHIPFRTKLWINIYMREGKCKTIVHELMGARMYDTLKYVIYTYPSKQYEIFVTLSKNYKGYTLNLL